MYCKNCGSKLGTNFKFCPSCGIKNNITILTKKRTINIICKVLLIFNYILMLTSLFEGESDIFFDIIMLVFTTIGVLETEQIKTKIFLILGFISLFTVLFLPFSLFVSGSILFLLIDMIDGFQNLYILNFFERFNSILFYIDGGILTMVVFSIIGILFIIIHKKQHLFIK